MYKDDDIVDELIDFFTAATQTSQFAIQTLTAIFAQKPEILEKIRNEFKTIEPPSPKIENTNLKKGEFLKKVLSMQMIHDLEYMNWVMMEALRMQPPASNTTNLVLAKDAKVGDLYLKKGDEFMVNITALSHNGE